MGNNKDTGLGILAGVAMGAFGAAIAIVLVMLTCQPSWALHEKIDEITVAPPTNTLTIAWKPDLRVTPGKTDPNATVKQLCTAGYTKDVRHVTEATKKQVFQEYGIPLDMAGKFEVDHFISLENGGLNDIANLWPQFYFPIGNDPLKTECWGAREKDKVETALHRWLCQGKITLAQDQQILRTDWVDCYKTLKAGKVCGQ